MVHTENSDCIAWLTAELEKAGKTRPFFHAVSRPLAVEREGTHRAITMSEIVDVPILLVHVSGADAVEQIRWARGRGLHILAETCPQYLVLTSDHLDQPGRRFQQAAQRAQQGRFAAAARPEDRQQLPGRNC